MTNIEMDSIRIQFLFSTTTRLPHRPESGGETIDTGRPAEDRGLTRNTPFGEETRTAIEIIITNNYCGLGTMFEIAAFAADVVEARKELSK